MQDFITRMRCEDEWNNVLECIKQNAMSSKSEIGQQEMSPLLKIVLGMSIFTLITV